MTAPIAVIIPNRNMGAFLGDALRTVALQGRQDLEVIVADAASHDGSARWVEEARSWGLDTRWLALGEPLRPGPARNRALHGVTAELLAFLDADDLWPEGKLARQLAFLVEHPEMAMVSGRVRYFDMVGEDGLAPAPGARTTDLVHVNVGACVWRRTAFECLGGFDESFAYAEDVDLLMRLREQDMPFAVLPTVELYYRQHAASMMATADPARERDFHRAALLSIRRRRAAGTAGIALPPLEGYLVR